MQLLWRWYDSFVYQRWDRVLKVYHRSASWSLDENKLHLYHRLQNRFAGLIFTLFDDSSSSIRILEDIKLVTFEVLSLSRSGIWKATLIDKDFFQLDVDKPVVVSDVLYTHWDTLKDLLEFMIYDEQFTDYNDDSNIMVGNVYTLILLLTNRLEEIYAGTKIWDVISLHKMIGKKLDPTNIKYYIKNWHMHLVVTDTLNRIADLKDNL